MSAYLLPGVLLPGPTFALLLSFFLAVPAFAGESCRLAPEQALRDLRSPQTEPGRRAEQGVCLVRQYLGLPEVAEAVLRIIKNSREDLFLRQDLVEAFADARLRRQVKVAAPLVPNLKQEDHEALSRTAVKAGRLLAVVQAVQSMEETVPVCAQEGAFVRTLAGLAESDDTPVILRASAVEALERTLRRIVDSGVYDARLVRYAQESLRNVAGRSDNAAHFSGAADAYGRLELAGLPFFRVEREGRALASEPR